MNPRKWAKRLAIALAAIAAPAALPAIYVETSCIAPAASRRAPETSPFAIPDPGYRRAEGDSFLTFPEWYIVHAYTDLAGVARQSSESAFDYLATIAGFWRAMCRATIAAGTAGDVTAGQKITNHIIGLSFTAEMAVIGAYERTYGALTAWLRGPTRTAEDEFALSVADDYAAFLWQTPWYEYPFQSQLRRFWRETPWAHGNLVRGLERRFALTAQYGGKSVYAVAMAALAGYAPADLRLRSVVAGTTAADLATDPRIKPIRTLEGGALLIETPRYREFTAILRQFAAQKRDMVEIAGNRRILVTILVPPGTTLATPGAAGIFDLPIQSRPGWHRIGYDAEVKSLTRLIATVEQQGAVFEHAYDY